MIYKEELDEMENGISEILKNILSQIRTKSVGPDYVLDDTKKEFENFFLNTANHRLTDAYQSYVFASRMERETNRMTQSKIIIKTEEIIEIDDDSNESERENEYPVQCSEFLVQSTTGDSDECEAPDSIKGAKKLINPSIGTENEVYEKQSRTITTTTTTQSITSTTVVPTNRPNQPHTPFSGLKFQCDYCSISRDGINDIYKHWIFSAQHADAYKAFQFHIEINGACFKCNKTGTFNELKQHFENDHTGMQFCAVNLSNKMKCLICCFSGENMAEHFRTYHTMTMGMDSFSPIRLQANILDELKVLRVQKKFKCDCCDNVVYNTKDQIIEHYRGYPMNHDIKRNPFIEFVDEQPTSAVCGVCRKTCNETEMPDHMENHQIQCLNCASFDGNINELALHYQRNHPEISMHKEKIKFGIGYLQTKFIHCNGLSLTYANVMDATDDEMEKIQSFFTVTSISPQFMQTMLTSPSHEPKSHDSTALDSTSSIVSFDENDLISPRSTGSKSDPNDIFREELLRQRFYLDTLVILGLPATYMNNDEHLLTMFGSLCLHLSIEIRKIEIKSIYSSQNELIVKLSTRAKKEKIIQSMASKYRWPRQLKSDEIVKIPPNEIPKIVYVNPKLTSHFHRLWMKAKRFKKQKKIYSYRLSTGGIAIRITNDGEEVFAKSFEDMENCVNGFFFKKSFKRATNTDVSTKPSPKRMKLN